MTTGKHTEFCDNGRRILVSGKLSEMDFLETVKADGIRLYFFHKMVSGAFGAICALTNTREMS